MVTQHQEYGAVVAGGGAWDEESTPGNTASGEYFPTVGGGTLQYSIRIVIQPVSGGYNVTQHQDSNSFSKWWLVKIQHQDLIQP